MKRAGYAYIGSKQMNYVKRSQSIEKTERLFGYFLYFNQSYSPIYVENKTDRQESVHLDYVTGLVKNLAPEGELVMVSMYDIATDEKDLFPIYELAWNSGVSIEFLETPWVSISFLKKQNISLQAAEAVIADMYETSRHLKDDIRTARRLVREHNALLSGEEPVKRTRKTKKGVLIKDTIAKRSRDFSGNETDQKIIDDLGVHRDTYYKYKKELKNSLENVKEKQETLANSK